MDSHPSTTPSPDGLGVVFDLGQVLIDWDPRRAIAAGVGEAEAERFLSEFDFAGWNLGPDGGQTWDDALADLERSHPEFVTHGTAYRENFGHSMLGPIEGTPEILRELHAAGVPVAALTNWSDELFHDYAPAMFDFLALFDVVVVSGTERLHKPQPEIYQLVVERTGRPASSWIMVDDRAENIAGAQAVGMDGILFTDADSLRVALRERGLPV
jgi:2-haloacid dehalogenase